MALQYEQELEPGVEKPIVIAAMQDMGNVASIVTDFIGTHLDARPFRTISSPNAGYVVDNGGHIEIAKEEWNYLFTRNLIIFGSGTGQPDNLDDLHQICRDVIGTAKKYSAEFIYTVGGLHTARDYQKSPRSYVTSTSKQTARQLARSGFHLSRQRSLITGFNGLILGYAKRNSIRGMGVYGELDDPEIPQYRTAKSVIQTLQRLTFRDLGPTAELDSLADDVDRRVSRQWRPEFYR